MIATHPTCQFIHTHNPKGACTATVHVAFHVSTCRERHNASASLTVQLKQLCVPPQEKGCDRNTHVSRCDNVAVAQTARSIGKAIRRHSEKKMVAMHLWAVLIAAVAPALPSPTGIASVADRAGVCKDETSRVVLVTGRFAAPPRALWRPCVHSFDSSRGLGLQFCRHYLEAGWLVVATLRYGRRRASFRAQRRSLMAFGAELSLVPGNRAPLRRFRSLRHSRTEG